jgi:PAS domain S-box-containing protein
VEAISYATKSGAVFPGETRVSYLRDETGAVQGFIAIIRDVSERLERQRELQRYEAAVEESTDMLVALDREGEVLFANDQYRALVGRSDDELVGTHLRKILGERLFEKAEPHFRQAVTGTPVEYDRVQRDQNGTPRTLDIHYYPLREGQADEISGVVAAIRDITEREERKQKLREFKQAVDAAGHAVYMTDPDGEITYVNAAFEELTGYSRAEAVGRNPRIMKSGEMSDEYYDNLWSTLTDGDIWEEELLNETKTGELYHAHQTIAPVTSEEGAIEGYVAIQTDISEQKANAEAIQRLSELRRISSAVNHVIARMGPESDVLQEVTEIIASSDRFECTFLIEISAGSADFRCGSGSELDHEAVADFHTEEYIDAVTDSGFYHIDDVTSQPFEQHTEPRPAHEGYGIEIAHDEHTYGVLTVHFPPDAPSTDEERELLLELAEDIGLYLHAKEAEEDRQTFAEIVQQIDDPIMLQGVDGTFEVANTAVTRHADLSREELLGNDEFAFMDEATARKVDRQKKRVLQEETTTQYEIAVSLPETGDRVFSTTRYPHYDIDGQLDGTIAICRDVTDLKTREHHLRVIDRLLRHNLNNDMTVILGNAEQIRDDPSADTARIADRIIETGTGLVELAAKERRIVELLSEPTSPEQIDVSRILSRVRQDLEEQYPRSEIAIEGDPDVTVQAISELEQAVHELMENAVKHQQRPDPQVTVTVERGQEHLQIHVRDEGPGIPAMDRQVVDGDADITALLHGSGLGLWLVKHIVSNSNGAIAIEDNEPSGSVVSIRLPLQRGQASPDLSGHHST